MLQKTKRPESVLVILHDGTGQVLVLERLDKENYWQSVTGSLEEGECPFETALREVEEEIGLVLQAEQLHDCRHSVLYEIFPHWRHRYAGGVTHNREHWFLAQIPKAYQPQLSEHRAYQWLSIDCAAELVFSPSNREAFEFLKKEKNNHQAA